MKDEQQSPEEAALEAFQMAAVAFALWARLHPGVKPRRLSPKEWRQRDYTLVTKPVQLRKGRIVDVQYYARGV